MISGNGDKATAQPSSRRRPGPSAGAGVVTPWLYLPALHAFCLGPLLAAWGMGLTVLAAGDLLAGEAAAIDDLVCGLWSALFGWWLAITGVSQYDAQQADE